MARTVLAVTNVTAGAGVNITDTLEAANVDGESIANGNEDVTFIVENGSGSSITVTVKTPGKTGGLDIAEDTWTVAAGKTYIGRFMKMSIYNQATGVIHVDFSAVTTVKVAAFKITI